MQEEALVAQSMVILVLVGMVVWQRYQRRIKGWWTTWRPKPKRSWTLQARTPEDCQDCQLAAAEGGP